MKNDNTIKFNSQKVSGIKSGSNVIPFNKNNDSNGGEPPMDNKYVTHKELELSNEKLLHHIDNRFNEMDKHFNKLELEINDVKNTTNADINDLKNTTNASINDLKNTTNANINDVKNTANTNKEKINWILYSVIGGIVISVFTTLLTNLFK